MIFSGRASLRRMTRNHFYLYPHTTSARSMQILRIILPLLIRRYLLHHRQRTAQRPRPPPHNITQEAPRPSRTRAARSAVTGPRVTRSGSKVAWPNTRSCSTGAGRPRSTSASSRAARASSNPGPITCDNTRSRRTTGGVTTSPRARNSGNNSSKEGRTLRGGRARGRSPLIKHGLSGHFFTSLHSLWRYLVLDDNGVVEGGVLGLFSFQLVYVYVMIPFAYGWLPCTAFDSGCFWDLEKLDRYLCALGAKEGICI